MRIVAKKKKFEKNIQVPKIYGAKLAKYARSKQLMIIYEGGGGGGGGGVEQM